MKRCLTSVILCMMIAMVLPMTAHTSDWATNVIGWSNLGPGPYYDDPASVLGKPTTLINEPGSGNVGAGTFHCSMVYGAWRTDPSGGKLVAMILEGGYVVAQFDSPVYDDPENWYGRDFIVFGNSIFVSNGYAQKDTNMESFTIKNGMEGTWEPATVSVSQYPNGPWYAYSSGPYADDFAPTQSFAWDYVAHNWGPELDFTKPIDPALIRTDFAGLTVASAIDMYKASAGGTAFDLADQPSIPALNQPGNPNHGRKWIQCVKVTSDRLDEWGLGIDGEADAFARVSHRTLPISIGQAKLLPDGAHVIIEPSVVSSGATEIGGCCYIEDTDRCSGIRVLGRVLARGNTVTLYGDLDTVNGERVIRSTAIEQGINDSIAPVATPIRSIGGGNYAYQPGPPCVGQKGVRDSAGLNNIGLLVRTCGRVKTVDTTLRTFTIEDGSGHVLKCIAPPHPGFILPGQDLYKIVTGISSCEPDGSELASVLRLRDPSDLKDVVE